MKGREEKIIILPSLSIYIVNNYYDIILVDDIVMTFYYSASYTYRSRYLPANMVTLRIAVRAETSMNMKLLPVNLPLECNASYVI